MPSKNTPEHTYFEMSEVERLLCLCIRHVNFLEKDKIRELYHQIGDNEVFASATLNGTESIVAHALSYCLPEGELPVMWQETYQKVDKRISAYMEELERVSILLSKKRIPLIGLKNSGITKGMYPYYGACPMGDIDVLVSKKDFKNAHKILSSGGYKLKFRSPLEEDSLEAALEGGGAEYSVLLPDGEHLWFELQFRPVAGRWIQPDQEPDVDELIERSVPIDGSALRLLSPEDNLLQVALHTAKHSFVRAPGFRLHTDVDRIVSSQKIDWDVFVERVKNLNTCTAVYLSLFMAKELLRTSVPEHVLVSLSPSKWKVRLMVNWIQKVGVFEPNSPKWSRIGYIAFVILLFDNLPDVLRGIFPRSEKLKEQYQFESSLLLPYYYILRLGNLIFRRIGI